MDDKKAKELLIKSGLSENKANEISAHFTRVFNEDKKKGKEEIEINELKSNNTKIKNVSEVITK